MVPVTLFNADYEEIGMEPVSCDIETGDSSTSNDIEITSTLPSGCAGICILGTDAGGIIEQVDVVTGEKPVKKAHTWRGLLTQHILVPPSGQDYLTVTNVDLNSAIRSILSGVLGGFFKVPSTSAGQNVTYQFNLYTNALTGLSAMCESVGYKLSVHAEKNHSTGKIEVICEALPQATYEEEFDEYSAIQMEFVKNNMMYTHLVCRGKGELQNRIKCDIYLQSNGTWGDTQHYTGFYDRQYFYENTGSETVSALKSDAKKKAKELSPYKELKIKKAPQNLEIGDRIKGSYSPEGISVESTINKKIYRVTGDSYTVEFSVK